MDNNELRLAIANAKGMLLDGVNWENEPMWRHHKGAELEMVPNWTEDIAAAWELATEAHLTIIPILDSDSDAIIGYLAERWDNYLSYHPGDWIEREIESIMYDTAPRAICLAWLAWKEGAK